MKIVFWFIVVIALKVILIFGGPALMLAFDVIAMLFIMYQMKMYGLGILRIVLGGVLILFYLVIFYYLIPEVIKNEVVTKAALAYDWKIQILINLIALFLAVPVSSNLASNNLSIKNGSGF